MRLPSPPGDLATPSKTQNAEHKPQRGGTSHPRRLDAAATATIPRTPTETEGKSRVRVQRQIEPRESLP